MPPFHLSSGNPSVLFVQCCVHSSMSELLHAAALLVSHALPWWYLLQLHAPYLILGEWQATERKKECSKAHGMPEKFIWRWRACRKLVKVRRRCTGQVNSCKDDKIYVGKMKILIKVSHVLEFPFQTLRNQNLMSGVRRQKSLPTAESVFATLSLGNLIGCPLCPRTTIRDFEALK